MRTTVHEVRARSCTQCDCLEFIFPRWPKPGCTQCGHDLSQHPTKVIGHQVFILLKGEV